jgi:hypothetical protein
MSKLQEITVRRHLRTGVATAGTVLLSVLVTLAVMRELTPPRAAALRSTSSGRCIRRNIDTSRSGVGRLGHRPASCRIACRWKS